MAFSLQIPTSQDDFITRLLTFAVAQGWTQDRLDTTNNQAALSKGNTFVQFEWDGNDIAVHQSTAFDGVGTDAGNHTGDSGNGGLTTSTRAISDIGDTGYVSANFFSGASPDYIHAVLEFESGGFRHLSFGEISKIGNWSGGAYACCTTWNKASQNISNGISTAHNVLMDAINTTTARGGTIRMTGMPGQAGGSVWGVVGNLGSGGVDGDSNARESVFGGTRQGPYVTGVASISTSLATGFIPLIPIALWHRRVDTTPDQVQLIGFMPDVKQVNMNAFEPGQEFVNGSDTWKIFPMVRKGPLSGIIEDSGFGGLAYLKS